MTSKPRGGAGASAGSRPEPGPRPAPASSAHTSAGPAIPPFLDAAASRVIDDVAGWRGHALSADDARSRLAGIVDDLVGDAGDVPFRGIMAERMLALTLIDRLRRELLADESIPDGELVRLSRRLESLSRRLEPDWHESLAAGFMGVGGRDLMVEVAHDLRSPLTSIMFLSETLRTGQSGQLNDTQRQQLGIIYSAALNLVGIASDIIDLVREDRFLIPEASAAGPFSVAEVLARVRGMVAPMAEEKRLDLLVRGPSADGRIGNAVALSRILLNLATNALKFTDSGRIEILARELAGARIEFSVQDTGRGMDDETVAALFEPFRRSHTRSGLYFSGTGLGLTIARRMLELMGSALQVETRRAEGSRFFFELELPKIDQD